MKIKTLLTCLAAIAMSFSVAVAADEDTPLSKQMSLVNKSLRQIKRNLGDPSKKAENLDLVHKINAAVVEACKLEPKKTKDQADKKAYLAKYQEEMKALGDTFAKLEVAIKNDKPQDAQALLQKLGEQKETGHKDFGVDED